MIGNSRKCNACMQRFEEEQKEISQRSTAHIQKKPRKWRCQLRNIFMFLCHSLKIRRFSSCLWTALASKLPNSIRCINGVLAYLEDDLAQWKSFAEFRDSRPCVLWCFDASWKNIVWASLKNRFHQGVAMYRYVSYSNMCSRPQLPPYCKVESMLYIQRTIHSYALGCLGVSSCFWHKFHCYRSKAEVDVWKSFTK